MKSLFLLILIFLTLLSCSSPVKHMSNTNTSSPGSASPGSITYKLNVTVSPEGSGFVSPSEGNYVSGTQVAINVTPAKGYIFSGTNHGDTLTGDAFTVVMNSNVELTVYFSPSEPPPWPNVTAYSYNNTIGTSVEQQFVIVLPYTSRVTADWAASYNESMVDLVDISVTNDTAVPGNGQKWFLFKALKPGNTELIMRYGRQPQGPYAEQILYSVLIN